MLVLEILIPDMLDYKNETNHLKGQENKNNRNPLNPNSAELIINN
jgi:hypothetical protein